MLGAISAVTDTVLTHRDVASVMTSATVTTTAVMQAEIVSVTLIVSTR